MEEIDRRDLLLELKSRVVEKYSSTVVIKFYNQRVRKFQYSSFEYSSTRHSPGVVYLSLVEAAVQ